MTDSTLMEGRTGPWEVIVGLEVHAQVVSESKLFSGAATAFGAEPNSQVSPIDAAMPGMLPVINGRVVDQAIRTGLALGAEINRTSVFDRKNYFYPDLPPGYQISQYSRPIVGRGAIAVDLADGGVRTVGITRLHLEQDAGKSLHDQHPSRTYVDLNRAGVALMEIVSEPDLRSAEEAALYLAKLRAILRTVGSCDGNMEQGSLRADANVSVRRPGEGLGTRCEIKNLNSIRFLRRAIEVEARRQIGILEDGGSIEQETRLFDPERGETRSMRSKEEAHDYRYFPDPDLMPLRLSEERIERLRASLPELPDTRKARYMREHGLSADVAGVLVADADRATYFDAVVGDGIDPRAANNWIVGEIIGLQNREGVELDAVAAKVPPERLARLIRLQVEGTISARSAKDVLQVMYAAGGEPEEIVAERGLRQVSDTGAIQAAVEAVLAANTDKVADYRAGKDKLLGFFVGQVMKATAGKADPKLVNRLLRDKLAG